MLRQRRHAISLSCHYTTTRREHLLTYTLVSHVSSLSSQQRLPGSAGVPKAPIYAKPLPSNLHRPYTHLATPCPSPPRHSSNLHHTVNHKPPRPSTPIQNIDAALHGQPPYRHALSAAAPVASTEELDLRQPRHSGASHAAGTQPTMATPAPAPVPSRRSREPEYREVKIGDFTRMEQIGQGSFATVYKARHTVSRRPPSYLRMTSLEEIDLTTVFQGREIATGCVPSHLYQSQC